MDAVELAAAERAAEQEAVRVKRESERRRRQALRASLLVLPSVRQDEIEANARVEHAAPSAELLADESAQAHAGRSLRDALAWEMERASDVMALPLPIAASSLAVALLTSHDYAHGADVESLPLHTLSIGRVWAHLMAVGLSIDPLLAASIARRAMTLLLNAHSMSRVSRSSSAQGTGNAPRATVSLAELPSTRDAGVEAGQEPVDATPQAVAALRKRTRHERKVIGYVRLVSPLDFHGEPTLETGLVLESIEANGTEGDEILRMAKQGRAQVLVWWKGKPRMLPASCVERVGAEDWKEPDDGPDVDGLHADALRGPSELLGGVDQAPVQRGV